MINLEEWKDYSRSASVIRCIEPNGKTGKIPRLIVCGVKNALNKNVFVPEDKDYALELIGEKKTN